MSCHVYNVLRASTATDFYDTLAFGREREREKDRGRERDRLLLCVW